MFSFARHVIVTRSVLGDTLVCARLVFPQSDELHDRLKPLLDSARKVLRSMKRSHAVRW